MKTLSILNSLVVATTLLLAATSCGAPAPRAEDNGPKQLNISILLDLSDRISPTAHPATPSHMQRDTAIIGQITRLFKEDMNERGAYEANGRIQVLMSPPPSIANINSLQDELQVSLAKMDNKQKKDTYTDISDNFATALEEIYTETNNQSRWTGSDIWRFFKNDVKDLCIARDTNYRNILVILTDGYIYDKNTTQRVGSRVQHLTPTTIGKYRGTNDPISAMENDDFGLMPATNGLDNLEVLVLEVTPENNNQKDELILKYCIDKWLKEMEVSRWAVHTTDLPANTSRRIETFLNN